jgi:hypothetical protein
MDRSWIVTRHLVAGTSATILETIGEIGVIGGWIESLRIVALPQPLSSFILQTSSFPSLALLQNWRKRAGVWQDHRGQEHHLL